MSKSSNFLHFSFSYFLVNVVRMVLALTYLFSGVVKLIDPRGTQYKIEDYGAAFGISNLLPEGVPLTLACILAIVEFLMGIYLFFGIRRRLATTVSICFLLVMTPLTLYLALKNPVSDCGCFGDALVLSNWQTFGKNVVLLIFSIIALRYYKLMPHFVGKKYQWIYRNGMSGSMPFWRRRTGGSGQSCQCTGSTVRMTVTGRAGDSTMRP